MKRHFLLYLVVASASLIHANEAPAGTTIPRAELVKKYHTIENKLIKIIKSGNKPSQEFTETYTELRAYAVLLNYTDQNRTDPRFFKLAQNFIHTRCVLVTDALTGDTATKDDFEQLRNLFFEELKKTDANTFEELKEYRLKTVDLTKGNTNQKGVDEENVQANISTPKIITSSEAIKNIATLKRALRELKRNDEIASIDPHGSNFAGEFKEVRAEILDAHKTGRGTKEEVIDNLNRMTQRFSEQLEKLNKEWLANIAPVTEPKNTDDSA